MGIGMGYAIAAAVETGKPVLAVEGDSAFGFSGMEVETICRYNLPVCIVIFNNDGIYRGTDVNSVSADPAPTVFVKGARYDKMIEAFGGVGVNATSPTNSSAPSTPRWTRQADAHQRGARPGRRKRERPHRQSQPAEQAEEEMTHPLVPAKAGTQSLFAGFLLARE
jgi:TPP-dependent 2-oxoacid decarboxylase